MKKCPQRHCLNASWIVDLCEEESKFNLQNVQQFLVNTVKARQVDITKHEENISSCASSDIDPGEESLGQATASEAECQGMNI